MIEVERVPLSDYMEYPVAEMEERAAAFYAEVRRRRTVRDFSARPVSRSVIENCLRAAGTAPNGANLQPWHFVVVSSPELKQKIRAAAEAEEREFYARRAPQEWLDALIPFETDAHKPFLETAPYLIAIFAQPYSMRPGSKEARDPMRLDSLEAQDDQLSNGPKVKHYYVSESVGIATGILITALHHAGLATLTHTPSPMGFLNSLLGRPAYERPFLLLVVGYPAENAQVPNITKKPLDEIATFL